MNIWKIGFALKMGKEQTEDKVDSLWEYLGCLYKNGQILRNYELISTSNDFYGIVTLPDDRALDEENNSTYVNTYLHKVTEDFILSFTMLGENIDQDESCCCGESSWYMLNTSYDCTDSPIVCGDCELTVPLYRFPHIMGHKDHFGVVNWQYAYVSTDILYIYGLSDRFTYRQLHDPNSQLSQKGREICKAFEEEIGKPFYYFIFHAHKASKKCPICGVDWKIVDKEETQQYLRCEKCRIIVYDARA